MNIPLVWSFAYEKGEAAWATWDYWESVRYLQGISMPVYLSPKMLQRSRIYRIARECHAADAKTLHIVEEKEIF